MIVVQRVLTHWTKRSRGAPGAVRRNAVAEAYPLPATGNAGVLVHQVVAREADDFAVREQAEAHHMPDTGALSLDEAAGVHLRILSGRLVVTGRPRAECHCAGTCQCGVHAFQKTRDVLALESGQWGRWRVNFRFIHPFRGTWYYEKWVVNVAYQTGPPPVELFRVTRPRKVADNLLPLR